MLDTIAKRGYIYIVFRHAVHGHTSDRKPQRPMVCVAERPFDFAAWTAMPRITTGALDGDLSSKPDLALGLSEPGWWTTRFIHPIRKDLTGKSDCRYRGTLEDPEKTRVLNHYKTRAARK